MFARPDAIIVGMVEKPYLKLFFFNFEPAPYLKLEGITSIKNRY